MTGSKKYEGYGPVFSGDGRRSIGPTLPDRKEGEYPKFVSRSTARMLIDMFRHRGCSNHSVYGNTLWIIREWCAHAKVPLRIETHYIDGQRAGFTCSVEAGHPSATETTGRP